jgi:hypothetical protein
MTGVGGVVPLGHRGQLVGSRRPSSTSVPTIMCRIDLAIDHESRRLSRVIDSAGRSK